MTQRPQETIEFLFSNEADPPVTVIREMRVHRKHHDEFERLMALLMNEAMRRPGHLGASVIRPQSTHDVYRFIYKFDKRSNLEAWHRSEDRARLVSPVHAIALSDRTDEFPGLETWFELPSEHGSAPPKWKTTLMSWAAIYVLVVTLSYALKAIEFEASIPVRALVLTVIVVPLVAYVVGPLMGRLLHGWLNAGIAKTATSHTPSGGNHRK